MWRQAGQRGTDYNPEQSIKCWNMADFALNWMTRWHRLLVMHTIMHTSVTCVCVRRNYRLCWFEMDSTWTGLAPSPLPRYYYERMLASKWKRGSSQGLCPSMKYCCCSNLQNRSPFLCKKLVLCDRADQCSEHAGTKLRTLNGTCAMDLLHSFVLHQFVCIMGSSNGMLLNYPCPLFIFQVLCLGNWKSAMLHLYT